MSKRFSHVFERQHENSIRRRCKNTWYTIKSEIQDGLQNMWLNDVLKVTDDIAITTTYTLPLYLFAANFHGGMYQGVEGRISCWKYIEDVLVQTLLRQKEMPMVFVVCSIEWKASFIQTKVVEQLRGCEQHDEYRKNTSKQRRIAWV